MAIDKTKKSATKVKKPSMPPPAARPAPVVAKDFTPEDWDVEDGEKIILYSDTGMGKTSLSLLAPDPVFLPLDDGGRKLRHPATGRPLKRIPNLETFADVRAALQQVDLFNDYKTVVIDTITVLEGWAEPHTFATVPGPKGSKVVNIEGYGYNKGYKHLYDTMNHILSDCDELIRRGKNVIMVAQAIPHRISNPGGEDYLRDGPRLYAGKPSIEALYCEWADHILRIDYINAFMKDKKISGDTSRAVLTQPELYFRAKSKNVDEAVVSFADKADDSIWQFMFDPEQGGE